MSGYYFINAKRSKPMSTVRCALDPKEIKVTNHAVTRYRERKEIDNLNDEQIREQIAERLSNAVLVEHKDPADLVRALLRHNYQKANYYRRGGLVFVVSADGTVLTVHKGEAKQWRPVFDN